MDGVRRSDLCNRSPGAQARAARTCSSADATVMDRAVHGGQAARDPREASSASALRSARSPRPGQPHGSYPHLQINIS